jgi:hypothetical protein
VVHITEPSRPVLESTCRSLKKPSAWSGVATVLGHLNNVRPEITCDVCAYDDTPRMSDSYVIGGSYGEVVSCAGLPT